MGIIVIVGIGIGCIYALVGIGYSLVYRTTGVVNFSQGSFVMLGGMTTYWLLKNVGLPYALSAIGSIVVAIIAGLVLWISVIVPLWHRKVEPYIVILATLVFSLVVENVVLLWQGSQPEILAPWIKGLSIHVFGGNISSNYIWLVLVMFALAAGLGALLKWTTIGKQMRACAASRDVSRMLGISPETIGALAMTLTAAIGAIGGIFITPIQYTQFNAGLDYGIYGFVAAVVGGFGDLRGAILGGLIIGVIQELTARYISASYEEAIAFLILLVL